VQGLEFVPTRWEDYTKTMLEHIFAEEKKFEDSFFCVPFLLHIAAIEKKNFNRTPSSRGQAFLLYKITDHEEWGLAVLKTVRELYNTFLSQKSYIGIGGSILTDILKIYLNVADIMSSYYIKIEPRNIDEERTYKDIYADAALRYFTEYDSFLQTQETLTLPKSIQETLYTNYFNMITSDVECAKLSHLKELFLLHHDKISKILSNETPNEYVPLEKLRTPFWWERYAMPYREKMDELCDTILNSSLFQTLPTYIKDEKLIQIFIQRPEIFSALILLFLEVIKRRASVFTMDYADALGRVLDIFPRMKNLTSKQAEDLLSILINFSYDEQIDKYISISRKSVAYDHCLNFVAPHNWSNRTQIRFLFWGCSMDQNKAKNAVILLKYVVNQSKERYQKQLQEQLDKRTELKTKEDIVLWAFEFGRQSFSLLMGIYGCFFVFLRDISDPVMKAIIEDVNPIIYEVIDMGNSPYMLFMPNDVCSRYQYYNFCDAFKSTEEKKAPIFRGFLKSMEKLVTRIEQTNQKLKLPHLEEIKKGVKDWKAETLSFKFFSKAIFELEEYDILLFAHLLIRARKLFFFWQSQLFKKEKDGDIYTHLTKLSPRIVKLAVGFQRKILESLNKDQYEPFFRDLYFEWKKFFDLMWEGVIFLNRVYGLGSKELVREAYLGYLEEMKAAAFDHLLPFDVKLALCQGFDYKTIAKGTELSKKLGIYNIHEFFQNIFYESGGFTLQHLLLEDVWKAKLTTNELTPIQKEFLASLLDFYGTFEISGDTPYQTPLLSVMDKIPLSQTEDLIFDVMDKISECCFKQLDKQKKKIHSLRKEIEDVKEKKKRLISQLENKENQLDPSKQKDLQGGVAHLAEAEVKLSEKLTKIQQPLNFHIETFIRTCGSHIFSLVSEHTDQEIYLFSGEQLQQQAKAYLNKEKEEYTHLLADTLGLYNHELSSKLLGQVGLKNGFKAENAWDPFTLLRDYTKGFQKYCKPTYQILKLFGDFKKMNIWESPNTNKNELTNTFRSFCNFWNPDLLEGTIVTLSCIVKDISNLEPESLSKEKINEAKSNILLLIPRISENNNTFLCYHNLYCPTDNKFAELKEKLFNATLDLFEALNTLNAKKEWFNEIEEAELNEKMLDGCYIFTLIDSKYTKRLLESVKILDNLPKYLAANCSSLLGMLLGIFRQGIPTADLIKMKLREKFASNDMIDLSVWQEELKNFDQQEVLEVITEYCDAVANPKFPPSVDNIKLKLKVPLKKLDYDTKDVIKHTKPICDSFISKYLQSMIAIYVSAVKGLYSKTQKPPIPGQRDIKDIWIDLLYCLKEYPYLFPHVFLHEIDLSHIDFSDIPSHILHQVVPNTPKPTLMDFSLRLLLKFDKGYIVRFFRVAASMWNIPLIVNLNGKHLNFNDFLLVKFMLVSLEILEEETVNHQALLTVDSIERLSTIFMIVRSLIKRVEDSEINNHFWEFVETGIRKMLEIVNKYSKVNFHDMRKILGVGLWNELFNIMKLYNDKLTLSKPERNDFYYEILLKMKSYQPTNSFSSTLETYKVQLEEYVFRPNSKVEFGEGADSELSQEKIKSRIKLGSEIKIRKFDDGFDEESEKQGAQHDENLKFVYSYFVERQEENADSYLKNILENKTPRNVNHLHGLEYKLKKIHLVQESPEKELDFAEELLKEVSQTLKKPSNGVSSASAQNKALQEINPTQVEEVKEAIPEAPKTEVNKELSEKKIAEAQNEKKMNMSEEYKYFIGRKFKTKEDFDSAVLENAAQVKRKYEEFLLNNWMTRGDTKEIVFMKDDLEKEFPMRDQFSRSSIIFYMREYVRDHIETSLREEAEKIYEEYQRINADFEKYLNYVSQHMPMDKPDYGKDGGVLDLNIIDAEENMLEIIKEKKQETNSKASAEIRRNQLFDILSKVKFSTEEADYNKPPSRKRRSKENVKEVEKKMDEDQVEKSKRFFTLTDKEIETIVELFFVKYHEPWAHDNFHQFIRHLLLNPYNEVRLLDALVFILQTPQLFKADANERSFPPMRLYNYSDKEDEQEKTYSVLTENILSFITDYFHDDPPHFFSIPYSFIETCSIESVKKLKEQYRYRDKVKVGYSGADLILGLLQIPTVYKDFDKAISYIRLYEKLVDMKKLNARIPGMPEKTYITSKNIHVLFGLIHTHWNQHHLVKEEISRIFQLFIDKPQNFGFLVPSLIQVLEISITESIPILHESLIRIRTQVKCGNYEYDESLVEDFDNPNFTIIEVVLRLFSSFFIKTLFETSFKPNAAEKKPLEERVLTGIEESLLRICGDLQTKEATDYMLEVYHILDLIYKKRGRNAPRSQIINNFVSIGVSYCLLFIAEEKLEEDYEKQLKKAENEDEFPELGRVVSGEADFSDMPKVEMLSSFTKIRENKDINFNLIYSNFGLKYANVISKLAKEPNGSVREEIWHLNQKFPWIFEFSTKKEILKDIIKEISSGEYRDRIFVDRKNAVHDFIKECSKTNREGLFRFLSVTFSGEAGIDDGMNTFPFLIF